MKKNTIESRNTPKKTSRKNLRLIAFLISTYILSNLINTNESQNIQNRYVNIIDKRGISEDKKNERIATASEIYTSLLSSREEIKKYPELQEWIDKTWKWEISNQDMLSLAILESKLTLPKHDNWIFQWYFKMSVKWKHSAYKSVKNTLHKYDADKIYNSDEFPTIAPIIYLHKKYDQMTTLWKKETIPYISENDHITAAALAYNYWWYGAKKILKATIDREWKIDTDDIIETLKDICKKFAGKNNTAAIIRYIQNSYPNTPQGKEKRISDKKTYLKYIKMNWEDDSVINPYTGKKDLSLKKWKAVEGLRHILVWKDLQWL